MKTETQTHTIGQMLVLHLLPGALLTAIYFIIAPWVMQAGYPALMALLICILVVLIPFELGVLFYQGRKLTGHATLDDVVLNRERIPIWQYFVIVLALLIWGGLAFILLTPVDNFLIRSLFAWMPTWNFPAAMMPQVLQASKPALITTVIFAFALNGILGPVTEELYFRGFLLPRIPAGRAWAPLINVVLFSLYHLFSPWANVTRIVALIPLVYAVAWKRNIYLSMITHCLLNTLGMLGLIGLAMR
jgi:membrane protease YdiL (CAAX protease family)